MSFAEHLMTLRKQRGWSQEELGSQINVTRQTVSKWEMGQSTPELEKLMELAKLFHISIDQLVGLEETEETGFSSAPHNRGDMRSVGVYYEYIRYLACRWFMSVWGLAPGWPRGSLPSEIVP